MAGKRPTTPATSVQGARTTHEATLRRVETIRSTLAATAHSKPGGLELQTDEGRSIAGALDVPYLLIELDHHDVIRPDDTEELNAWLARNELSLRDLYPSEGGA